MENCAVIKNNLHNFYMLYVGNQYFCVAHKSKTFYKYFLSTNWNKNEETILRVWHFICTFSRFEKFSDIEIYRIYCKIQDMIACGAIKLYTPDSIVF